MASQDMALSSCDEEGVDFCQICKTKFEQPRVLSCLHVFCEECLKKLLPEECLKKLLPDSGFLHNVLRCPSCGQETKVFLFLFF